MGGNLEKEQFVSIHNISLEYKSKKGKVKALQDVSVDISKGDFVGIIGPSGCGKTSLLKVICGLISPSKGEVFVGGKKVDKPLKNIGMAFQNPLLLRWRTILDNVCLPLEIVEPYKHDYGTSKQKYVKKAKKLLNMVGLGGFEYRYPWELSGGMQQRASLCRALIHDPEILLLDEPFGALDAFTREELWGLLQRLWNVQKCTVILITHDIREAIFLSNVVHVMSPRPGTLIHMQKIYLPRPRKLSVSFSPNFTKYVKTIRNKIGGKVE